MSIQTALPLIAALSLVNVVRGQQTALAGPIQAFTFDPPTRSIRALTGSLGAASFGPALVGGVDFGTIAPRRNYGIVFRRGQTLSVSGLGSAQMSTIALESVQSVPEGAAWSNDGSVAVLYSRSANWIEILTGFPGPVSPGTQMPLQDSLSAIAADAHGQRVVVGFTGDYPGVYQVGPDQSLTLLLQASAPISLSFSADGNTLFTLDQATNQIFELTLSNLAVQTWPTGLDDAIAIRAASDTAGNNVLYVAGRNSRQLLTVDRSTHQTVASATLSFPPAMIEPLGSNGFLLMQRSTSNGILWTFTNTPQPAIYFVPAITSERPREAPRR